MTEKSYLNKVRKVEEIPSFAKKAAANLEYQKRVAVLRKRGAIPFAEIGENFTKISWDLFKKKSPEPDAGSIWQVTKIKNANGEEESWLVVYTDDNDKIIRQVKASIGKTAQEVKRREKLPDGSSLQLLLETWSEGSHFVITIEHPDGTYDDLWESKEVDVDNVGALKTIEVQAQEKFEEYEKELIVKTSSKKTAHTPGAIVQVVIPPGHINEKYNGKVGEVTAAVPDRSKISFKDLPPLWFEDNTIQEIVPCPMCQANVSLQKLKKVGKIKCKCGTFYTWRQLEKIAKTAAINEKASKKKKADIAFPPGSQGWSMVQDFVDRVEKLIEEGYEEDEAYQITMDEQWMPSDFFEEKYVRNQLGIELRKRGIDIPSKIASVKTAKIVEKGDEWCVIAESGRSMGCYPTKPEAEERLKQVEMFKHMKGSKKAQNVIFWFDDPAALRSLKHLQGPPTSPAGEKPLERPEELEGEEKPELEAKEVEKEASKKQKSKISNKTKEKAKEKIDGIVKESLVKEAQEENEDITWEEQLEKYRDEALEYFSRLNIVPDAEDILNDVLGAVEDASGVEVDPGTAQSIAKILGLDVEAKKINRIEKKAQGGSSFEALRGGGGGASDQLAPMGWQVQETKTPKLPEQAPELREEEEVEEIVIRVSPEDKAVKIDFEGEKEEEVEKPVGAEAPPEKPIVKPGEELEEEEEGLGEVPVNF